MERVILIDGMTCEHCVKRVTNALQEIEGVETVEVDLEAGSAKVTLSAEVEDSVLEEAIEEAGYDIRDVQ